MKRILPDEVRAAAARVGYKVVAMTYTGLIGGKPCGCPQTILYLDKNPVSTPINSFTIERWANVEYGSLYAGAFRHGFDGCENFQRDYIDQTYTVGYEDGQTCRRALLGASGL